MTGRASYSPTGNIQLAQTATDESPKTSTSELAKKCRDYIGFHSYGRKGWIEKLSDGEAIAQGKLLKEQNYRQTVTHARMELDQYRRELSEADQAVDFKLLDDNAVIAKQRELSARRSEYHRQRSADNLFANAKCPERHTVNLAAAEGSQHERWTEIRDMLAAQIGFASGFLVALLGPSGTGKTQLSVSVIQKSCYLHLKCRYVKIADLFRDVRRSYVPVERGEAGISEAQIVSNWVAYDLLVLDEVHQRGETSAENNLLINILDSRYDARRPTILIANQDKKEFAACVGDSIISRIHETGEAIICDWPSFRKPGSWKQADDAPKRTSKIAASDYRPLPDLCPE
jgi:DNA replication protein DnaC